MGEAELIFADPLTHGKTSTQKSEIFLQSTKRNYDVSGMGRFTRNMFHWNKNDIKSSQMTNGDYYWLPKYCRITRLAYMSPDSHMKLGLTTDP